ncbi:hypothetical protein HDE_05512 [Halotydeus destructor]|nr:hypothetical protein HDE_05512 [Halotydeus destructor]
MGPMDGSLSPLAEMLSTTSGKSPLVAATYYFNPTAARHPQLPMQSLQPMMTQENRFSFDQIESENDVDTDATDPGACLAPDGRKGSCYEANECVKRGGMPMGTCNGGGGSPSLTGSSGSVCCLFEISCGDVSSERYVYFRNPGFPSSYTNQRMCRTRVVKKDKSICQYRVDLVTFDLAPPSGGNCSQDIFVVSGQNENHIVPKICGQNNGHHYHFGVDESGIISFHMMMLGNYHRKFNILVSQIPCRSEAKAPSHCLQYQTGTHGTIKSFNYDQTDSNAVSEGYPNDIDYMICVKKEPGFCSITYELTPSLTGVFPFAVGAPAKGGRSPIVSQCKDDYLVIGGLRLCSASLQSPSLPSNLETHTHTTDGTFQRLETGSILNATLYSPTLITDTTPGPFLVRFVSSQADTAKGFNLSYRQNPCK